MLQSKTWEPSFCLSSRPHGQLRETLQGDAGVNWETALLSTERATSIQDVCLLPRLTTTWGGCPTRLSMNLSGSYYLWLKSESLSTWRRLHVWHKHPRTQKLSPFLSFFQISPACWDFESCSFLGLQVASSATQQSFPECVQSSCACSIWMPISSISLPLMTSSFSTKSWHHQKSVDVEQVRS